MSRRIVQPVGKIKLTNVAVIRYECGGKRFEIACYKNKIMNWRNGIEQDLDEVLQIPHIFLNVAKGITASNEDLMHSFHTTNRNDIVSIIMEKGVEQVSGKEREHQLQSMSTEIATLISEMCYNPDTDAPFTVGMIQRSMKDCHIVVKLNQTPKKQALTIIQVLKKHMRIERKQMKIQLVFPEHQLLMVETFCEKQHMEALKRERKSGKMTFEFIIDPYEYKMVDTFCQATHITCNILERQMVRKEAATDSVEVPSNPAAAPAAEAANEPAKEVVPEYMSFKFKCSTCEKGFEEAKEHREHFRSDWHRYNMKRKNKNLPIMSEEEFNSLSEEDRELFLKQDSIAT